MIKVSLPDISSKEVNEVKNILYSNWIVEGPKTKILEDKFKKRFKKKFCIFFNSWTTAAFALFKVLNIKEGSEIILPSLSFIATANAPLLSGYKLKFVDVPTVKNHVFPQFLNNYRDCSSGTAEVIVPLETIQIVICSSSKVLKSK